MPGRGSEIPDAGGRRALADRARRAARALETWTVDGSTAAFNEVLAQHELKLGKLAQPVRVAVTGGTASPGIFEVLDVLGARRTRTVARVCDRRARDAFLDSP